MGRSAILLVGSPSRQSDRPSVRLGGLHAFDSLFTEEGHQNGTDQLLGGPDTDRLFGDAPDDWCSGLPAANDVLRGGPDNDFLMGHGGADRALGGEGNNLLSDVSDLDCERGRSEDTFDGGAGRDGVRADSVMDDGDSSVTVDLAADTLLYGDGTVDGVELIEDAEGSPNADTLLGYDGPNALLGGYGDDTLRVSVEGRLRPLRERGDHPFLRNSVNGHARARTMSPTRNVECGGQVRSREVSFPLQGSEILA